MSTPLSVAQPGLVLAQSVITEGYFPTPADYGYEDITADLLGVIITTAFSPSGVYTLEQAQGQTLKLSSNNALGAVLGNSFGGQTGSTFVLPNLMGAAIVGTSDQTNAHVGDLQGVPGNAVSLTQAQLPYSLGGFNQPLVNEQYGQHLQYIIKVNGYYPSGPIPSMDTMGTIYAFAGDYVPEGFMACDGTTLPVDQFQELYSIIGNAFGSDQSFTSFQLPDLRNAVPIGAGGSFDVGETTGRDTITLFQPYLPSSYGAAGGQIPINTFQPSVAVNFAICVQGMYNVVEPESSTLGQVVMLAGERLPDGWVLCQGQQLPIDDFPNLYQLIGTQFGGDGQTSFAVPDLRDRTVIGSGPDYLIGQAVGQPTTTIGLDNLPDISVPVLGIALANDSGASGTDHISGDFAIDVSNAWFGAQIEYSTDGQHWSTTFQAHEGKNTVYVRQIDVIGQTSQPSNPLSFILDTTAPVAPNVSVNYAPIAYSVDPTGSASATVPTTATGSIILSGLEARAVVTYSTDGGRTWSEHFEAAQGLNTILVRQTDLAGNVSVASQGVFTYTPSADARHAAEISVQTNATGGHEITVNKPGDLPVGQGTPAVDTIHFALGHSFQLPADLENVTLLGVGAGNAVTGNALDNRIEIQDGSWVVDGGAGKDTVHLAGKSNDYLIRQVSDGQDGTQFTLIGPSGKLVLKNVDSLQFDDLTATLTNAPVVRDLHAIYSAALERAPDLSGLAYWQRQLDSGVSLSQVADRILSSVESQTLHGQQSARSFVSGLYELILQRPPELSGLNYWSGQIEQKHATQGEVLVQILHSQEAVQIIGSNNPLLGVVS